jgi:hypothetical protein
MSTVAKFTYAQALRSSIVSPPVKNKIVQNAEQFEQQKKHDDTAGRYIEALQKEEDEKRERAQVQAHLRRGKVEGPFTNPYQWDKRMAYLKYVIDRKW